VRIGSRSDALLKLAQKFLGHSTIEMTADIYTHISAEVERDALNNLSVVFPIAMP
jgi:integrase